MNIIRTVLILSLLALPSVSQAFPFGGVTVGDAEGGKCVGNGDKKSGKTLAKFKPMLGTADSRKAWKKLIGAQAPGCDAILAHIEAGGEGFEAADFGDIGKAFAASGVERYVSAARALLLRGEDAITRRILGALESQLPHLTVEETNVISTSDDPEVRMAAIPVLIGYYAVGEMTTVMGIPTFKEVSWRGAVTAPPAHHVTAVEHIVSAGGVEERRKVAKFASRLYLEGNPNQEAWAPLLTTMLDGADDDQDAANLVARGLASAELDSTPALIETVLSGGNEATIDYLLKGFDHRLATGRGSKSTVAHLETIAASSSKHAKTAKKLAKKHAKKF